EVGAAGGVVAGHDAAGRVAVLLVHRPRYDDWSLPKGKCDPGESDEDCARREVEEETGLQCDLGVELPSTHYVDRKGRTKQVRYWAMTVVGGGFAPNDEVDEVRWLAPDAAEDLLSYAHDIQVVAAWRAVHDDPTSDPEGLDT
ncbi:MAG TPA: NUDIX hydrolase, partial [Iamia sp.]|nr:NUDIX hydrolase [Iamia sp.]